MTTKLVPAQWIELNIDLEKLAKTYGISTLLWTGTRVEQAPNGSMRLVLSGVRRVQ